MQPLSEHGRLVSRWEKREKREKRRHFSADAAASPHYRIVVVAGVRFRKVLMVTSPSTSW